MGRLTQNPEAATGTLFRVAGAFLGLAIALPLGELMIAPAVEGQLPGFMTAHDMDASGPMRSVLLAMLLPFFGAYCGGVLLGRLRASGSSRWSEWSIVAAWVITLALSVAGGSLFTAVIWATAATTLAFLFRRTDVRFSSDDWLLLPAFLVTFAAVVTLAPSLDIAGASVVAALALGVARLFTSRTLAEAPGSLFALAPLGAIPIAIGRLSVSAAVVALALVFLSPFVVRYARLQRHLSRRLVAYVILPLFVCAYAWIVRPIYVDGLPRVNFFEDGHSLLPASEMLRGERPYADIVPGHGLFSDGLLDYLVARAGGDEAGTILGARERTETLLAVAVYFLGLAASGSPAVGLLGFLLACSVRVFWTPLEAAPMALMWTPAVRSLPALFALAFMAAGVRLRRRRAFFAAALLTAFTMWVSIDFFGYIALTLGLVALRLWRPADRATWLNILGGGALGFGLVGLPLGFAGLLDDFFVVTLREVLTLSQAYAIGFFQLHERYAFYQGLPEIAGLLFVPSALWFVSWGAIALFTLAEYSKRLFHRPRRDEAWLLVGLFIVIEAIAYGERLNVHFMPLACVFGALATHRLWRSRVVGVRYAAVALALTLLMVGGPTRHLRSLHAQLTADPKRDTVRYADLRRADGALFEPATARALAAAAAWSNARLGPGDTYFDFASVPILYYLLERNCPIRQYEVPFFESERLQREVIGRLQRDASVKGVLMSFPDRVLPIDGVGSPQRAPLVYAWLQREFEPDFSRDGVVFWKRRSAPQPASGR